MCTLYGVYLIKCEKSAVQAASESNCDPIFSSTRLYAPRILKTFWQQKSANVLGRREGARDLTVKTGPQLHGASGELLQLTAISYTAQTGLASGATGDINTRFQALGALRTI